MIRWKSYPLVRRYLRWMNGVMPGRWFCAVHAEDEAWHHCILEQGGVGGEG